METIEVTHKFPSIGSSTLSSTVKPFNYWYKNYFKRFFDLSVSIFLLPFVVPVLLLLMLLVKFTSKGPAIYKSLRVGKDGKKFCCYKLRTMHQDAETKLEDLLKENPSLREEYTKYRKLKRDPRITGIGRFLRTFSLDELPQIFNILRGEMSLVGPRPACEEELLQYGTKLKDYQSVLPGITGPWQINGRNDTSFKSRVLFDASYHKMATFLGDLGIILKTIPITLSKKGAY